MGPNFEQSLPHTKFPGGGHKFWAKQLLIKTKPKSLWKILWNLPKMICSRSCWNVPTSISIVENKYIYIKNQDLTWLKFWTNLSWQDSKRQKQRDITDFWQQAKDSGNRPKILATSQRFWQQAKDSKRQKQRDITDCRLCKVLVHRVLRRYLSEIMINMTMMRRLRMVLM